LIQLKTISIHIALLALLTNTEVLAQQRFKFSEPKMGSNFEIIFYANDSTIANGIASESFRLVDSLTLVFSDYLDSSELNKLSASAGTGSSVKLSQPLYEVLLISRRAWHDSNGAFDITIGPLSRLWRKGRKANQFPSKQEIENAKARTGFDKIELDTGSATARLTTTNMQLDLGGIAQGYIAQAVAEFLLSKRINSALVNVSGDIVCTNAPPEKKEWAVGVNIPTSGQMLIDKNLLLKNKAVSTSGDVYQYVDHDGKKYSHVIDPRTGYGVTTRRNVTVVANDGATADWLSTACCILSKRKARKLVKKYDSELLITDMRKGKLKSFSTKGFWKSKAN
jgi:FAD:protein FMN transferase